MLSYVHTFGPRTRQRPAARATRGGPSAGPACCSTARPPRRWACPASPRTPPSANALPTFTIDGFQQLGSSGQHELRLHDRRDAGRGHVLAAARPPRASRPASTSAASGSTSSSRPRPPAPSASRARARDLPGTHRHGPLAGQLPARPGAELRDRPPAAASSAQRAKVLEVFVQDDWRATSRLTVNAGAALHAELPVDRGGRPERRLQPGDAEARIRRPGRQPARRARAALGQPRARGWASRTSSVAKTVVRAGYALVWIEQAGITTPFTQPQFPFLQNVTSAPSTASGPPSCSPRGPRWRRSSSTPDAGLGQSVFCVDRDLGSGYAQQWNVAVQRELGANLAVEVAYAGLEGHAHRRARHEHQPAHGRAARARATRSCSACPTPASASRPAVVRRWAAPPSRAPRLLRPYPCFNTVSLYRNNVGNTSYNALEVKLEKRFSRGLSFLVSYTWSKLIDTALVGLRRQHPGGAGGQLPGGRQLQPAPRARRLHRRHPPQPRGQLRVGPALGRGPALRARRPRRVRCWTAGSSRASPPSSRACPVAVTQVTNFNAFAGFGTQRPNRVGRSRAARRPSAAPRAGSTRTPSRWRRSSRSATARATRCAAPATATSTSPSSSARPSAAAARRWSCGSEAFNVTNTPPLGAPERRAGRARLRLDHQRRRSARDPARPEGASSSRGPLTSTF